MNFNKKGYSSTYIYFVMLGIAILSALIVSGTFKSYYLSEEIINKTKSFYSAETGIEEGLLEYKKTPDIDAFIPQERVLQEMKNGRKTEYTDQKVYKKELVIKERIEAGKSIQLPFRKKDLDSRITKFHLAVLQHNTKTPPTTDDECNTPEFDSAVEISAYQKANILSTEPLDYTVELNSNWNSCYIGNNATGKTSLITYSDPFSKKKISLIGDKCIMNSKGNVVGSVFEDPIPYKLDDKGDALLENNTCEYDCAGGTCSLYYTHDDEVNDDVKSLLKFYTIADNFIWDDMSNDGLIMFNIRAVDNDVQIALWATDDAGNAYEIPGRFVNFSALGKSHGGDIKEGLFTRLRLKKKANSDLLPIFDYSLFSEEELVK